MPKQALTQEEKTKNRIKRETAEYMESVREFLKQQNNGEVPFEFSCSLICLESYYSQLLMLNDEISKMDSVIVPSRYGITVSPILKARDSCVQKLLAILVSLGCTFKERAKMKITEPKAEESPLEAFVKSKTIEHR